MERSDESTNSIYSKPKRSQRSQRFSKGHKGFQKVTAIFKSHKGFQKVQKDYQCCQKVTKTAVDHTVDPVHS